MSTHRKNVTLSLPAEILQEARTVAMEEGISLSKLLADILADMVERRRRYDVACRTELQLMQRGLDLGTDGRITWDREELHGR